ncbi:MAG: outer membrane beta-barrel protein [Chlorobiaceae bacterium]
MKKLLLPFLAASLSATPVFAAPYVSLSTGLASLANSDFTNAAGFKFNEAATYKSGVPFVGAVGINNGAYRVEVAIGYQSNDFDKFTDGEKLTPISGSSQSALTYLLNGYYDIDLKGSITPYLTAGLGGATLTGKTAGYSDESHLVFAYQLGAGVGIKASENIVVDLGYRYLKPSSFKISSGVSFTELSNNFLVGVRYNF